MSQPAVTSVQTLLQAPAPDQQTRENTRTRARESKRVNLLIGLAVGDIDTVRKDAQLKRLTMQVDLHTDLERKLPRKFIQLTDKKEIYEYPNRCCGSSLFVRDNCAEWLYQMLKKLFFSAVSLLLKVHPQPAKQDGDD